jgi:diguanylate cyclase (GGDEF)-like protein/PAS domain S-box-containing protein
MTNKKLGITKHYQYVLQGFLQGLMVPLVAYLIEIARQKLPFSFTSISTIHKNNPLLWIIDSLPLLLASLSWIYQRQHTLKAETDNLKKEAKEHSRAIIEQQTFYESLVNNSPIAIATMNADQKILSTNEAFTNIFQYQEHEVRNKDLDEIIACSEDMEQAKFFTREVTNGGKIHGVGRRKRKDGSLVDVEIYGVPIVIERERIGILGMYIDITNRKEAEDVLIQSEERFRGLFHNSPISMWEVDFSGLKKYLEELGYSNPDELKLFLEKMQGLEREFATLLKIIDVNQTTLSLFKADDLEDLRNNFEKIFIDQSAPAVRDIMVALNNGAHKFETEFTHRTLDGFLLHTIVRLSLVGGCEDDWSRVYVSIVDITERKWTEERLRFLSMHDTLTNLYNRMFFETELTRLSKGRQLPISIIVCDLDNLKLVNDTYGHKAGDDIIKKTATLLQECFRCEDIVARLGGDEFAVIIPKLDEATVDRIIQRLRDRIGVYNHTLPANRQGKIINLSIGSATTVEGMEMEELFKAADKHMYQEKKKKRKSSQCQ